VAFANHSPLPAPGYRPIADENWMAAWKDHYHPIPIVRNCWFVPAWLSNPERHAWRSRLTPAWHLAQGPILRRNYAWSWWKNTFSQGKLSIDIGCGSGILSIAALKLGAARALAVDIDPASVKATAENSSANGVLDQVETGLGSVSEVREGEFSFKSAPVVLANILAPVIIRLFNAGMADLVDPQGVIILAGILAEQADGVKEAAGEYGLSFVEMRQSGDWVALVCRK